MTVGLVLSAIAAILYIVCTATHYWFVYDVVGESSNAGLWRRCTTHNYDIHECVDLGYQDLKASVYGSRAFMITACSVCVGALILGLYAVIRETVNKAKIVSGCAIALTGLLVLFGTLWYDLKTQKEATGLDYKYGYSIILGWIAIPLAIGGGGVIAYYGMPAEKRS
ncbi:peripheral myelin protein 22-like [Glandiceps talaboti]